MVMSCHGEFSFCWDRSCGALPPRSPATERLLSTESYLASAQRVCWIRKLMRVPRGLVSAQTSLPSFQAHQGASFLDSCPSPSSLQGGRTSQCLTRTGYTWRLYTKPCSQFLTGRVKLTLSWYPMIMKYQDRWVWRPFYPNIHALLASFLALFSDNQWEKVQIFLFKKINKISILPNLLQYWMFDFSRTLFPFDLISALGDSPSYFEKRKISPILKTQSYCFI